MSTWYGAFRAKPSFAVEADRVAEVRGTFAAESRSGGGTELRRLAPLA